MPLHAELGVHAMQSPDIHHLYGITMGFCIATQDIAAPLYAQLLANAAQRLGPSPAFYSLWPVSEPAGPWAMLAAKLFREVSRQCLHTLKQRNPGCMHQLKDLRCSAKSSH